MKNDERRGNVQISADLSAALDLHELTIPREKDTSSKRPEANVDIATFARPEVSLAPGCRLRWRALL